MAWIIDIDHLADLTKRRGTLRNAVGLVGPSTYEGDGAELKCKFRMLTDDGDVCYVGRCTEDDSEVALGPLDDFGMPNAGCTIIQYWVKGKGWKNLN